MSCCRTACSMVKQRDKEKFSKMMVNYSSGSHSKCFKELDKTVSSVKYTVLF